MEYRDQSDKQYEINLEKIETMPNEKEKETFIVSER